MDCRTSQNLWQQLPGPKERTSLPEWGSLQMHLAACPACRQQFSVYETWESRLSAAMTDIAIPAGLLGRLQERLAEARENQQVQEVPLPLPRRSTTWFRDLFHKPEQITRRSAGWKILGGTAAVALLALLGWSQIPLGRQPAVDLDGMVSQLTRVGFDAAKLEPFTDSFVPRLPSPKEMLYPAELKGTSPKSLSWGGREVAAVYSFSASRPAPKRPTILLVVFSQERCRFLEMPRATSFAQADFVYVNDRAVKVWWQDGFVYCCFATEKGTEYLEQLRPSVYSS
ncbi:MAG: hypothetical protein U0903_08725 [Planctomycetales bacterium]